MREMDRGKIADTIEAERVARWGENWNELDMNQETHESIHARGIDFVRDIASWYAGQKVLVVTHGYFLGQTFKELMKDESTGYELRNTSVTTIINNGEKSEYVLYDCIRHLSEN
nr:histidine phosphatase family protein [Paenibacillus qinlingensis]